ncbi:MAG: hypothetical protein U1E77_18670 [Inhella sp.]
MSNIFDLSKIGSNAFESLVNALAMKVIGPGVHSFCAGADGGRDGYFEGEAQYPSQADKWRGRWYLQSKFHSPHLSKDPQKWLINEVKKEIEAFQKPDSDREWPDNWIIASNIEPSGKPETGAFDAIRALVAAARPNNLTRVAVWGGGTITNFLANNASVADYYRHLLTPGNVIAQLIAELNNKATVDNLISALVVAQFSEHRFTKLDQAGSHSDARPGIHDLFIDIPYKLQGSDGFGKVFGELCIAVEACHKHTYRETFNGQWKSLLSTPKQARSLLIKGGPGQGKSTIGQYLAQIQRATLISTTDDIRCTSDIKGQARRIMEVAEGSGYAPVHPRIPVQIELKEYAKWRKSLGQEANKGVLAFVVGQLNRRHGFEFSVNFLRSAIKSQRWLFVFDGLDEVPSDTKDLIAEEILDFLNFDVVSADADVLGICTSRPQGYSGQFDGIDGPTIVLSKLSPEFALACAEPVLKFGRTQEESERGGEILANAMESGSVRELMTTPLQSHIMAVIVRDGGRPPERRWALFHSFYQIMKKREAMKQYQDRDIERLLREEDRLLKSVHDRLGFVLHARAELSEGAATSLPRASFQDLVGDAVYELAGPEGASLTAAVMNATTERLVLVNTPDSGEFVRFEIRQLQEFFAAEFLYTGAKPEDLRNRLSLIAGDPHWREVVHFVMSALVEQQKAAELAIATAVLSLLDEFGEDGEGMYAKRATRGAIQGLRLLLEGVLEQDARDRQSLRKLIAPVASAFQSTHLTYHDLDRLPRSKNWLVAVLLDWIKAHRAHESVNAFAILGVIHIEADEIVNELRAQFNSMPIQWREEILRHFNQYRFEWLGENADNIAPSCWLTVCCIDLLGEDCSTTLDPESVNRIIGIVRFGLTRAEHMVRRYVDNRLLSALLPCIKVGIDKVSPDGSPTTSIDAGPLVLNLYGGNWLEGACSVSFGHHDFEAIAQLATGLLRYWFLLADLAKSRTSDSFQRLAHWIEKAPGKASIGLAPAELLGYLPHISTDLNGRSKLIELPKRDNNSFDEVMAACKSAGVLPYSVDVDFSIHDDEWQGNEELWCRLILVRPDIAIHLATEGPGKLAIDHPKIAVMIVDLLLNNPARMVAGINTWARIEKVRPGFIQTAKERTRHCEVDIGALSKTLWKKTDAFELKLPEESWLLPHLAGLLVGSFFPEERGEDNYRKLKADKAKAFGLTVDILRIVRVSSNANDAIFSASLALEWVLQAPSMSDLDQVQLDKYVANASSEFFSEELAQHSWLIDAFVPFVLIPAGPKCKEAQAAASRIMVIGDESPLFRGQIQRLISDWNEVSMAPISKSQSAREWLGYTKVCPSYAEINF